MFVQLEDDLEGLLHVSELVDHKVEHPENMVQVGQDLSSPASCVLIQANEDWS
ncbi:MAG: S1 RNA-binding domain-containing protein [Planctomycetaceae bacterium]